MCHIVTFMRGMVTFLYGMTFLRNLVTVLRDLVISLRYLMIILTYMVLFLHNLSNLVIFVCYLVIILHDMVIILSNVVITLCDMVIILCYMVILHHSIFFLCNLGTCLSSMVTSLIIMANIDLTLILRTYEFLSNMASWLTISTHMVTVLLLSLRHYCNISFAELFTLLGKILTL